MGRFAQQTPELRQGDFLTSLLEQQRRPGHAFLDVVSDAYIDCVGACKADDLCWALGLNELDKSDDTQPSRNVRGGCGVYMFEAPAIRLR